MKFTLKTIVLICFSLFLSSDLLAQSNPETKAKKVDNKSLKTGNIATVKGKTNTEGFNAPKKMNMAVVKANIKKAKEALKLKKTKGQINEADYKKQLESLEKLEQSAVSRN